MSDTTELVLGSDRAIALQVGPTSIFLHRSKLTRPDVFQASIQKALSDKGYSAEDGV